MRALTLQLNVAVWSNDNDRRDTDLILAPVTWCRLLLGEIMRLSRWCSVVRLIGFLLLVLASCPFTAPFRPVDLATPADSGPLGAATFLQAKGTIDLPTTAPVIVPTVFTPPTAPSVGSVLRRRPSPAAIPLHIPLRI